MRSPLRSLRPLAAVLALGLAAPPVMGHGGASGIVKERMDLMEAIGEAMKGLTRTFKGEVDYDAEAVRAAAGKIRDHAAKVAALFPEGSLDKPSEALPAIWQDWPAFEDLAERMGATAGALAEAAGNPPGPGGGMMGQGTMSQGTMGQGMMGQDLMAGGPSPEQLAQMPPQAAFRHLAQTCNACHSRFRVKKN